jgi:hypothetical protein
MKIKDQSSFMKFCSVLLSIVTFGKQRSFMEDYVTTIGYVVYVPASWSRWDDSRKIMLLRHERVHMRQRRRLGWLLFNFLYLFPFFPLCLAYGRARLEWEAYEESMRAAVEFGGPKILGTAAYKSYILSQFLTGAYGWMWPFKKTLDGWYTESSRKIIG